jgi:hypothetical protein
VNISTRTAKYLFAAATVTVASPQALSNTLIPPIAAALPATVCIDHDGDGWGWTGTESCKVSSTTPTAPVTTPVTVSTIQPKIQSDCLDTNGDGWGWHNGNRCQVSAAQVRTSPPSVSQSSQTTVQQPTTLQSTVQNTTANSFCVDSDGDGWGWDGSKSCRMGASPQPVVQTSFGNTQVNRSGSAVPENCDKINSGNYHITELVTDVFLSAGQSNATGNQTHYNPGHHTDRINNRVIVWTERNQWEVANPQTQVWHDGKYPRGHNHPAFQIARGIADNDSCRVVAFIATAASGMPIDYWLNNEDSHYSSILHKVNSALNALPHQYRVDMIWWMQGEADDDEIIDRYSLKLAELIRRFRSQNWFANNGLFLANETRIHTYANEAIRRLANDSDNFTDFSRGADSASLRFPSILPAGVHFNAQSLRQIGDLVADKYVYDFLPRVNR